MNVALQEAGAPHQEEEAVREERPAPNVTDVGRCVICANSYFGDAASVSR